MKLAVLIPTRRPKESSNGPPELPALMLASVCTCSRTSGAMMTVATAGISESTGWSPCIQQSDHWLLWNTYAHCTASKDVHTPQTHMCTSAVEAPAVSKLTNTNLVGKSTQGRGTLPTDEPRYYTCTIPKPTQRVVFYDTKGGAPLTGWPHTTQSSYPHSMFACHTRMII